MGLMSSDANVMQRERFTRRWKRRFGPGSGRWKWMFVNWWNIQYPQWFSLMLQHEPPLGAAAPFDTKEQHLYSELPPGVWNGYPILNPEASQPMETLVSAPCTCTSHTLKHVYHRHNSTQLPIVKVVMEKQISMAQFDSEWNTPWGQSKSFSIASPNFSHTQVCASAATKAGALMAAAVTEDSWANLAQKAFFLLTWTTQDWCVSTVMNLTPSRNDTSRFPHAPPWPWQWGVQGDSSVSVDPCKVRQWLCPVQFHP